MLRAHAERHGQRGFVFTRADGQPLSPERLSCLIRTFSDQAGLPPVRFHDLRHGAASLALAAGTDLKVVQDMLGHASIVLTAYTSVLPETARQAPADTVALIHEAGRVVPGTHRPRRRENPRPPEPEPTELRAAA
ncbi:tyrosine-type recombinase/integrase [Streptacidiphilus fuscans]|uniref:tyrosine-type recombinase/integrase n=1 Tax=Streptacidiphilus fuscans TaxID=2789292 RepID=UPI0038B62AEE